MKYLDAIIQKVNDIDLHWYIFKWQENNILAIFKVQQTSIEYGAFVHLK